MSLLPRIAELLGQGRSLVVITLVEARGSSPREPGARLLLLDDGSREGTVGGGLLEARALEEASRIRTEGGPPRLVELRMDAEQAGDEGMLCGGWARLLIERLG